MDNVNVIRIIKEARDSGYLSTSVQEALDYAIKCIGIVGRISYTQEEIKGLRDEE